MWKGEKSVSSGGEGGTEEQQLIPKERSLSEIGPMSARGLNLNRAFLNAQRSFGQPTSAKAGVGH
jgi:hypothetical protein